MEVDPHILPFFQQLRDPFFHQDSAHSHITRRSIDSLAETNVNFLPWPLELRIFQPLSIFGILRGEAADVASFSARIR